MKNISYRIKQSHVLEDSNLEALLANCRANNSSINVTGLLIYHKGHFFPYIEGEASQIDHLFEKIKKDPRQYELAELASGNVSKRQFENWSMAFRKIDDHLATEIPGYKDLNKKIIFTSRQ